ncbi:MAG: tectonin domain-containing protein, partial [Elainellaceae cyanobacterium]
MGFTPTKEQIDEYARNHGFPDSDYPYCYHTTACGSGNYSGLIPNGWYPVSFEEACNNHDRCNITIGTTQKDCDNQFYRDLKSAIRRDLSQRTKDIPILLSPIPSKVVKGGFRGNYKPSASDLAIYSSSGSAPPVPLPVGTVLPKGIDAIEPTSLARGLAIAKTYALAVKAGNKKYHEDGQKQAKKYKALVEAYISDCQNSSGDNWIAIGGAATDIDIGADGSVWVVGTAKTSGGYRIYKLTDSGWSVVPGGAVKVAVAPDGHPWVINDKDHIFQHTTDRGWVHRQGAATDIDIGADGSAWIVGNAKTGGGYQIYKLTDSEWNVVPGGAVKVAVAPDGHPWVINDKGHIFQHTTDRGWVHHQGAATDIDIGADGSVWVVGTTQAQGGCCIYRLTGSGWQVVPGGAANVAVDQDKKPWIIDRE